MFSSTGILHYGPGIRIILNIDQGVADYYRHLIPSYYEVHKQKYAAHITVVRSGREKPTNMEAWGRHQGEEVAFQYSPEIQFEEPYWYLHVWSARIGEIRKELGLEEFRFNDGSNKRCYHISIGNSKCTE